MRLAARTLSHDAPTSRWLVHNFRKPFALRIIKRRLRPVYHVVFVQQQQRWTRICIYILLYFALNLRRRRIYFTEEAFGCVQYFTDGVNEESSKTFFKKCACSTSWLSATTRKRALSYIELLLTVNFTLRNSL